MGILKLFLLIIAISISSALHLSYQNIHEAATVTLMQAQISTAIQNLTQAGLMLNTTMANLNPYNQTQRITTLANTINSVRSLLF